mmetsp:Transcript_111938/g.323462  ORF Transcript_111938/g.323462 Transcript_111938/m.323462 type:complete len:298 (-) Transcript_111938:326-1219(-)
MQRIAVASAAGVEVVPQQSSARDGFNLDATLARGYVGVPRALAARRPRAASQLGRANGLVVFREDGLAPSGHVVQVPKDRGQSILVAEMGVFPYLFLVRVQLQFSPVHVAVIVLALTVLEHLHILVVAHRHACEPSDALVELGNQRRHAVRKPSLLRRAELFVFHSLRDVIIRQQPFGVHQAHAQTEAHYLRALILGEEASHLKDLRPQAERPQCEIAVPAARDLLLEADAHRRPHPHANLVEEDNGRSPKLCQLGQAVALHIEERPGALHLLELGQLVVHLHRIKCVLHLDPAGGI